MNSLLKDFATSGFFRSCPFEKNREGTAGSATSESPSGSSSSPDEPPRESSSSNPRMGNSDGGINTSSCPKWADNASHQLQHRSFHQRGESLTLEYKNLPTLEKLHL